MKLLASLLLILAVALGVAETAHADTGVLTWVNPTQNIDGSPLTDLASINIYRGPCGVTPITGSALANKPSTVPGASDTYTDATPPSGNTGYEVDAADSAANLSARSAQVCKVYSTLLPNLVVTSLTISPLTPHIGDVVTYTAVVKNIGTAGTVSNGDPTTTGIGISFSTDGTSSKQCQLVPGPLAAGASVTLTGTSCNPLYVATAGPHTVVATVDDALRIPESNEADNTLSISYTVSVKKPKAPTGLGVN